MDEHILKVIEAMRRDSDIKELLRLAAKHGFIVTERG